VSSIRVLASVIRDRDRVLICRRPIGKRHGGLWEFPGGKVEAGESNLEAAARELREELDVTVTAVEAPVFIRADEGSAFVIEFLPTAIEGTPEAIEHSELAWVHPGDLEKFELAPSDRAFAEQWIAELSLADPDSPGRGASSLK
jgi:8-oxo-dGTP diphosphatase